MWEGLQTLIAAVQYVEQQDNSKLPPQAVTSTILNEQRFLAYDNNDITSGQQQQHHPQQLNGIIINNNNNNTINNNNNNNNNNNSNINNNLINKRGINVRHTNLTTTTTSPSIAASAPAATGTFQHATNSCITITNGSNGVGRATNSQLIATNHHHNNDYEFSNGGGNAGASSSVTANGRTTSSASTINSKSSAEFMLRSSPMKIDNETDNEQDIEIDVDVDVENDFYDDHIRQQQHKLQKQQISEHNNDNDFIDVQQQQKLQSKSNNIKIQSATASHHIHNDDVVASKHLLLDSGMRMAILANDTRIFGNGNGSGSGSSAMSISQQLAVPIVASSSSLPTTRTYTINNNNNNNNNPFAILQQNGNGGITSMMSRHQYNNKSSIPLTPPPMSSRKSVIDTQSRTRSFSLSQYNKISANKSLLHNGGSGMIIDDHHSHQLHHNSYGGSNHSPPRGTTNGGSHYMQLSGSSAGSQLATHSSIGGSGRRRTISSNSNGAGNREVHNILEKNRRAHLKQCYEALKKELPLKEEDRKKTSNLAILDEAIKHVQSLKKQHEDVETEMEQEAKKKINLQKIVGSLKRELGPKCEQLFSGMFPDSEWGIIPSEKDNMNDNASLSSGRGSILYSSSSSLSSNSGGSNGNTMSSPIGAGMQTGMPTAISPVISKTNSNSTCVQGTTATSPISPNMLQHIKASPGSAKTSPTGSPNAPINGVINVNLGGSSTPSPSPSSSSSSMISTSPPINGVINGRHITVNITNGHKFQTASTANAVVGTNVNTIGNGSATIISTSPPGSGNNSNNASTPTKAVRTRATSINAATTITPTIPPAIVNTTPAPAPTAIPILTPASASTVVTNGSISNGYGATNHRSQSYSRKRSLHYGEVANSKTSKKNATTTTTYLTSTTIKQYENNEQQHPEDSVQPPKFLKVFNGATLTESVVTRSNGKQIVAAASGGTTISGGATLTTAVTSNNGSGNINNGQLQLTQMVGAGNLVVCPATAVATSSPAFTTTTAAAHTTHTQFQKLPGGAELNILPTNGGAKVLNGTVATTAPTATAAFYHANGKLTLVNGSASTTTGNTNGTILLKENATELSGTNGMTPIIVTSTSNGNIQYAGNLAQLMVTTTTATNTMNNNATNGVMTMSNEQRMNGKIIKVGGAKSMTTSAITTKTLL